MDVHSVWFGAIQHDDDRVRAHFRGILAHSLFNFRVGGSRIRRGVHSNFADAIKRPHTIAPDALARNPKPLKIETVGEEREIADKTMTVQLYRIAGNPHADTMLMAYFPKQRVLVEADAFSPGSATQPYAANLLENITKHNLKVDRIVPLHGTIAPFSELLKTQAVKTD